MEFGALNIFFRFAGQALPQLLDGFTVTLLLAATALPLALALAVPILALRLSAFAALRIPAIAFIELMRNTPLLPQMFMLYFGLPLLGWRVSGFACGVAAMTLQHGAFFAELYRGAVASISRRQWEAGAALGLTRRRTLVELILPQALVRAIPAMSNQIVLLAKDTSLVSGIGVLELTLTAKTILERTAASFEVFIIVAILYLAMTVVLQTVLRVIEHRLAWRYA
jgi:polar amino acid transport system permease protein